MVWPSAIAFKRWALKRLSLRRDHLGRIPMSSVSSARSAANVWITSSSSTSVTCAVSCRDIFNIITGPEHISHSTRIVRGLAAYSLPPQARLLRSRRWAVCIIATNVAPHDLRGPLTDAPASAGRFLAFFNRVLTATVLRIFHSFRTGHRPPRCTDRPMNTFQHDHPSPNSDAKYIFEQEQVIYCLTHSTQQCAYLSWQADGRGILSFMAGL